MPTTPIIIARMPKTANNIAETLTEALLLTGLISIMIFPQKDLYVCQPLKAYLD